MDIQYSILQIDGHKLNSNCWNGIESEDRYPATCTIPLSMFVMAVDSPNCRTVNVKGSTHWGAYQRACLLPVY